MSEKYSTITINGESFRYPAGTLYSQVAADFEKKIGEMILLVKENHRLRELRHTVKDGSEVSFITYQDKQGLETYMRSLEFLMFKAVRDLSCNDPAYDVKILFRFGDGIFCTISDPSLITEEFLEKLKNKMETLASIPLPIRKQTISTREAIKRFHNNRMFDKEQLFNFRLQAATNIYNLDGFEDYFYGYMLMDTSYLKGFSLSKYKDGFLLRQPADPGTGQVKKHIADEKLFVVQRESFRWGKSIGIDDVGDLNDLITSGGISNLILTQEAYHEMQISQIAAEIASDPRRKIVLIAGPSSSGKTTFSHRLSTQLSVHGLQPHPIPVDDYFVDREKTPLDEDGNYNFEALEAIDIELFNKNMLSLLAGETVDLPTFNFRTGKREYKGKKLKLMPEDILVIEGIHGLNEKLTHALPAESKYRIYISALTALSIDEHNRIPTTDGRLIRRIVRDARTRGTSAEDTIAMWPSVRRGEDENIFPHQGEADVMFNSALIYELSVLRVYAEQLLYGIGFDSPQFPEARRLLKFLSFFIPIASDGIPNNSLLREFIGGSCFDV